MKPFEASGVPIRHSPATQTIYAQLYELAAAHELDLIGGFANGLPATDPRVRELRDTLAV